MRKLPGKSLATTLSALALLCFTAGSQARADALTPEARSMIEAQGQQKEVSVIVTLADQADIEPFRHLPRKARRKEIVRALKHKAESTQTDMLNYVHGKGAQRARTLWLINGIALTAPAEAIRALAADSRVAEIRPDHVIPLYQVTYSAAARPEWNIDLIGARDLWSMGYRGQGIVVANMDSGVDLSHPDLRARWRGGKHSWLDPYGQHQKPFDGDGHGTMSMGVMVGGRKGGTAIGVAPSAKWIGVKIFDDSGYASDSSIHEGFQWLLDPDGNPDTDDAPDVVNNSWGSASPECSKTFLKDIRTLKAAGIAVVFAAGNEGPGKSTCSDPASNPEVFSTGSIGEDQQVSPFSSRGPSLCNGSIFPSVTAPGAGIRTCSLYSGKLADSYSVVDGTSFSAPHAAGAMALLLSAFPGLTVDRLEQALTRSTTDLGPSGADNSSGSGLINVKKAYSFIKSRTLTKTFLSTPGGNGWIAESAQGSGQGGQVDARSGRIVVGDNQRNEQLKAILSFRTADIPNNAIITSATLILTAQKKVGQSPYDVLRTCFVDVLTASTSNPKVRLADFGEAPACRRAAFMESLLASDGISTGFFGESGLRAIKKKGYTQLRVYFSRPTNGDGVADAVVLYGDNANANQRPKLKVTYMSP